MAEWSYLLADLRTNQILADVELSDVRPTKRLGSSSSVSGSLRISSTMIGDPYVLTRPGKTALYALRDGSPWWGGIIWTSRYMSSTGVVSLGASDWWSYFDHRKILPTYTPDGTTSQVSVLSVAYTAVEQNQMARNLVTLAQSHTGGDIGITLDTSSSTTTRDRTYYGYELADVGTALKQLSELDGGPDIMFDVSPTLDANGRPVRLLRLGTPTMGTQGSPHVFEYGGNVLSYDWPSDATKMVTRSYAIGSGLETGRAVAVVEDSPRYADGWAMLEADSAYATVLDDTTLIGHATGDQAAGRLPVALPTLTVRGDGCDARGRKVGPSIGDYGPGDDAKVIITDQFFTGGINTTMRIVAISVDPGAGGVETATLTMMPVLDDVA